MPSHLRNQIEHLPGPERLHHLLGAGVDQIVLPIVFDRLHERIGGSHGDVEVRQRHPVLLGGDEIENVRVIHREDAHVRAHAHAALSDLLRGGVEDLYEGEGAAGDVAGGRNRVPSGAQPREGEPDAPPGLVDQCGVFDRVEDLVERVAYRYDETSGELLKRPARAPEGRRVGEKLQPGHHPVELLLGSGDLLVGRAVLLVRGRDVSRHPSEHILRPFDDVVLPISLEIAFGQHRH